MTIYRDVVDTAKDLIDSVKGFIGLTGSRTFNDINKEAAKHTMHLYVLASSNVDPEFYRKLAVGVVAKTRGLIYNIFSNYVGNDIQSAIAYVQNNLSTIGGVDGGQSIADNIKDSISAMNESLDQSGIEKVASVKIDFSNTGTISSGRFNESLEDNIIKQANIRNSDDFNKSHSKTYNKPMGMRNSITDRGDTTSLVKNTYSDVRDVTHDNEANYLSPSTTLEIAIKGTDKGGRVVELVIKLMLQVSVISISSEVLINAIKDAKNRGILNDYIEYKAKKTGLMDLVLNIKALKKEAKRDTSSSIEDRLISELTSKRGLLIPTAFSDLTEFKNFIVALDINDADKFARDTGGNIMSTGSLKKIFDNFNVMSLLIIDLNAKRITIFDSNKPSKATVLPTNVLTDEKRTRDLMSKLLS